MNSTRAVGWSKIEDLVEYEQKREVRVRHTNWQFYSNNKDTSAEPARF